jgi:cell division protein FtsI (penicillin-binding protein 3)
VFKRIAEQVLEYLHVPHDIELSPNRQLLLASHQAKDQDLQEGSPDHPGDSVEVAESSPALKSVIPFVPPPSTKTGGVIPASLKRTETAPLTPTPAQEPALPAAPVETPQSGTVVLDVQQGGIVVPSFIGKTVRGAIESAQDTGLDLDAVGSGIAEEQNPAPGSHVTSGSRVTVKFGR